MSEYFRHVLPSLTLPFGQVWSSTSVIGCHRLPTQLVFLIRRYLARARRLLVTPRRRSSQVRKWHKIQHLNLHSSVPFSPRFVPRDAASTAGDSQQNRDERSELGQRLPKPLWAGREDVIAYLHKIKTWAQCCSQCPTILAPNEDRCLYCNFITEPLNPDMYFWWQERTGLQAMRVILQQYGAALIEGPSWDDLRKEAPVPDWAEDE
ncbi:hypothetical protein LTR70_005742 [Exophiala xenobiotica]|uniref:Uncharacterized protein n=1 Tax=Lithohypha guttulata TaxID=1690604 RepID=A0ABR0K8Y8_9EURO|nr:hypothetical protein LTR24_005479 [Lithohypha guttulata]KAK5317636.1 hypothetical protein LTR70_005742 [Exophiala xenobiotica]